MNKTHIEGERFIHRDLWVAVERQREHAKASPRGAFYDDLVALVFAFHTLEAYLNFLLERLAPDIWADERNFFKREPYRGFDGKLRKVLELAAMPTPVFTANPYSVVSMLKGLRDTIAHGKLESFSATFVHAPDDEPDPHRTSLATFVTDAATARAVADIEVFIEELHEYAKKKLSDVWAMDKALRGPLQWSTTHTTRAS